MVWPSTDRWCFYRGVSPPRLELVIAILGPSHVQVSGMAQIGKQMIVQALVTQSAIETFHEAVLHYLAEGNAVPVDLAALLPFKDGVRRQFRCRRPLRRGSPKHCVGASF